MPDANEVHQTVRLTSNRAEVRVLERGALKSKFPTFLPISSSSGALLMASSHSLPVTPKQALRLSASVLPKMKKGKINESVCSKDEVKKHRSDILVKEVIVAK
ncbi:jg26404 [Pararge aegeria aegeria]|uniref:Jg26404 protein n=1 Tax=Pararge aegeria aegeria TaxID=348720 RepID=A0A8S4QI12_9NEOP|nr:jg26404 [Pararge aegeria aegeria]